MRTLTNCSHQLNRMFALGDHRPDSGRNHADRVVLCIGDNDVALGANGDALWTAEACRRAWPVVATKGVRARFAGTCTRWGHLADRTADLHGTCGELLRDIATARNIHIACRIDCDISEKHEWDKTWLNARGHSVRKLSTLAGESTYPTSVGTQCRDGVLLGHVDIARTVNPNANQSTINK